MGWGLDKETYDIYVDGACRNNQKDNNVGAWAFIVFKGGQKLGSKSNAEFGTTNNKQELTAVYEALKWSNKLGEPVNIYCDSEYVINSVTKWMIGWYSKGWVKADGKPVANLDLMKSIYSVYNPDKHTFIKIKGHSGNTGNDAVDELCNVAMDELILNDPEYSPLNFND